MFREIVEGEGVEIDRGTIQLVRDLRASGIRVGVATPSRNGAARLRRAKIYDLFDALVGGVSSAELHVR